MPAIATIRRSDDPTIRRSDDPTIRRSSAPRRLLQPGRAPEWVFAERSRQSRADRVLDDVSNAPADVCLGTQCAIMERAAEDLATGAARGIRCACGVRIDAAHEDVQWRAVAHFDQRMPMVRHDHPCERRAPGPRHAVRKHPADGAGRFECREMRHPVQAHRCKQVRLSGNRAAPAPQCVMTRHARSIRVSPACLPSGNPPFPHRRFTANRHRRSRLAGDIAVDSPCNNHRANRHRHQ